MTKAQTPLVSIIIVNWNGGNVFKDCLMSLVGLEYQNWELIIVDNGSTDDSENFYKEFKLAAKKIVLVKNKTNLGFAPANNQGYKESNGEYILFLNNDTRVSSDLISVMVRKMEQQEEIGVMQPKIYMMDNPDYLDNAGSYFTKTGFLQHWGYAQKDSQEFNQTKEVFSVKGACMFTRRKVVDRVGLFDPDFVSYFEETDFCWRVWLSGYKCIYYPETHIFHKVGFTSKRLEVIDVNTRSLKNRISALIKNLGTANLFFILPVHLSILVGIMLYHLIRLELKQSRMYFDSLTWFFSKFTENLNKRKGVQKLRMKSDKYIFDRIAKKLNIFSMLKHFFAIQKNFH